MEIIDLYLKELSESDNHSKDTVKGYKSDLNAFAQFVIIRTDGNPDELNNITEEIILLSRLNEADIFAYMRYLTKDCMNGQSAVNRKLSALKKFYRFLKTNRYITHDIVYDIKTKFIEPKASELIKSSDWTKLMYSVKGKNKNRDLLILMLFYYCGLSIDEVINIKKTDFDKDRSLIRIDSEIKQSVELNEPLKSILSDYLADVSDNHTEYLLSADGFNRIGKRTIHQLMTKHFRAANLYVKGMTSENLRKSGAMRLLANHRSSFLELQEFMGHKNSMSTKAFIKKQGIE